MKMGQDVILTYRNFKVQSELLLFKIYTKTLILLGPLLYAMIFFIKIQKDALLGWKNPILKYVGTKKKKSYMKSTFTRVDLTTYSNKFKDVLNKTERSISPIGCTINDMCTLILQNR